MKNTLLIISLSLSCMSFADEKKKPEQPPEKILEQKVEVDFSAESNVERARNKSKKAHSKEVVKEEKSEEKPIVNWAASVIDFNVSDDMRSRTERHMRDKKDPSIAHKKNLDDLSTFSRDVSQRHYKQEKNQKK